MKIVFFTIILLSYELNHCDACTCLRGCIDKINVLAITASDTNSESNSEHFLQVTANGEVRHTAICGPGKKCSKGSVDYFTLDIERFGFSTSCIRKEDIEALTIKENGNDAWQIGSIFVFLDTCETHELASSNPNFNQWIDGDGSFVSAVQEKALTLVL